MDREAEEAGCERVRVQLILEPERLRDVHLLAEARIPHEQLGREREDQRDARRDAHARRDVRHRARELDAVETFRRADVERTRRVERDRVDIAHAVHRLHEQRPERTERREEDLTLQRRAERQEQQGDQRRARDGTQKLDRHAKSRCREIARPEQDADRHRERGRNAETERPAARRLEDRVPERAGLHQAPELAERRRHRREVLLRDRAGA
jgi:hypothetical protein